MQLYGRLVASAPSPSLISPAANKSLARQAARKTASHVLALHLQKLIETGEGIPPPSSIIEVVSNPRWRSENVDAIILAEKPVAREH